MSPLPSRLKSSWSSGSWVSTASSKRMWRSTGPSAPITTPFLDCPGSRSALLLGTRSTLKTLACRCTSEKSSVVCCRDPPKLLVSSAPSLMRRSQSSASVGSGWEAAPGAFEKGCPGAGCTTRSASTPMRGESWTALSSLLMLRLMSLASLEDSMLLWPLLEAKELICDFAEEKKIWSVFFFLFFLRLAKLASYCVCALANFVFSTAMNRLIRQYAESTSRVMK
mmetsp:Transcript_4334/g.12515  ORF Transcript_4334/g.12515 Transcript_4334/m.12515 type:complete len:224 (+) Transcript_4334:1771-2442(+)